LSIHEVYQSDDGRYRLGLHDDTSPGFETRTFAASVLALERGPPDPETRSPAAENGRANRKVNDEPTNCMPNAMRLQEVIAFWRSV
jgi:hypothetical protein